MADAAEHHHRDDHHRLLQAERLGRYEALEGREHHARDATERGTHAEREQLHVAGVDAHRLGGDLVFANRHPGAADAAALEPTADHRVDHDEREEQVVVVGDLGDVHAQHLVRLAEVEADVHLVDLRDALRAVGDVDRHDEREEQVVVVGDRRQLEAEHRLRLAEID